jgi:hypothetical protein
MRYMVSRCKLKGLFFLINNQDFSFLVSIISLPLVFFKRFYVEHDFFVPLAQLDRAADF